MFKTKREVRILTFLRDTIMASVENARKSGVFGNAGKSSDITSLLVEKELSNRLPKANYDTPLEQRFMSLDVSDVRLQVYGYIAKYGEDVNYEYTSSLLNDKLTSSIIHNFDALSKKVLPTLKRRLAECGEYIESSISDSEKSIINTGIYDRHDYLEEKAFVELHGGGEVYDHTSSVTVEELLLNYELALSSDEAKNIGLEDIMKDTFGEYVIQGFENILKGKYQTTTFPSYIRYKYILAAYAVSLCVLDAGLVGVVTSDAISNIASNAKIYAKQIISVVETANEQNYVFHKSADDNSISFFREPNLDYGYYIGAFDEIKYFALLDYDFNETHMDKYREMLVEARIKATTELTMTISEKIKSWLDEDTADFAKPRQLECAKARASEFSISNYKRELREIYQVAFEEYNLYDYLEAKKESVKIVENNADRNAYIAAVFCTKVLMRDLYFENLKEDL